MEHDRRGKAALLIIGGGIAAYKSLELIRRLRQRGVSVRAILTKAGAEFITPLSVSALSGESTYQDLFSISDEAEIGHIQLSRSADLVVVAPATADLMAKLANGLADDLASTALLATDKPVLMAPGMNVRMWNHASTQRNLASLQRDGVRFVGPGEGEMACGEWGPGRMAEPDQIVEAVERLLAPSQSLAGRKALVTAGPTREAFDPVRYLSNLSSGKQGYAIAKALAEAGADTTLVSGPVSIPPPPGARLVRAETARDMLQSCEAALPVDIAVFAAAISDWRPETQSEIKLKKGSQSSIQINLTRNPDILATLARGKNRPGLVIGFAAETNDIMANASAKRRDKGSDWIVANDVGDGAMGGDQNRVHLITEAGIEDWPLMEKSEVARRLVARISAALAGSA